MSSLQGVSFYMPSIRLLSAPHSSPPFFEWSGTRMVGLLIPKSIPLILFGTRDLKYWILGPSGPWCQNYTACPPRATPKEPIPSAETTVAASIITTTMASYIIMMLPSFPSRNSELYRSTGPAPVRHHHWSAMVNFRASHAVMEPTQQAVPGPRRPQVRELMASLTLYEA